MEYQNNNWNKWEYNLLSENKLNSLNEPNGDIDSTILYLDQWLMKLKKLDSQSNKKDIQYLESYLMSFKGCLLWHKKDYSASIALFEVLFIKTIIIFYRNY